MRGTSTSVFALVAGCALLASCGGGGGSTPTPSPTPTPTPSPTPTPTPTATVFDFARPFSATSVNAAYIYAYFAPTGGSETWSDGSVRGGVSTIAYATSPESVAFGFPDNGSPTTFAATDLVSASATLRTYKKGTDGISLELPFHNVLRVIYDSKSAYTSGTTAGTLHAYRAAIFYNTVTTTSAITSNLSYTGTTKVVGGTPGTSAPGVFTSTAATLTVNASDSKLSGTIQIYENVAGVQTLRATLPISATVGSTGSFSGSVSDSANGYSGTFVGTLAGPNREEILLLFDVATTDKKEFVGSYIGG